MVRKCWLSFLLLPIVLVLVVSCVETEGELPLSSAEFVPSPVLPTCKPTFVFTEQLVELNERFERIVPGKTTERDILELLGIPQDRSEAEGRVQFWYAPPHRMIVLQDGIVVGAPVLTQSLDAIVKRYGPPDLIVIHFWEDGGCTRRSSTKLVYNQHRLVYQMALEDEPTLVEGRPLFTPGMRADGYRLASGYFDEYLYQEGLTGDLLIGDTYFIVDWPGFSDCGPLLPHD